MEVYYSDTRGAVIAHARSFIAGFVKRSTYAVTSVQNIHRVTVMPPIIGWLLYFRSFSAHRVYVEATSTVN